MRLLVAPYVSSTEGDVFAIFGLPEEVIAVLFAYYSRSSDDLRTNLAKLIADRELDVAGGASGRHGFALAAEKARAFHEKWVVGYGHASVAEHAVIHLAIENVSILASKWIEDARLASFTEKSTRYVVFGKNSFVDLPELPEPERRLYQENCERLFGTYLNLMPRITEALTARSPAGTSATAIRSQACDLLRGLLPAGTKTNIGITANARTLEGLLSKMMSSPLEEVRRIAVDMHAAALVVAPTLLKYAAPNAYRIGVGHAVAGTMAPSRQRTFATKERPVRVVRHDKDALARVATALAFENGDVLVDYDLTVRAALDGRGRHDSVPRGFEASSMTFEIMVDYGAYRDLQRHRLLSPATQRLTAALGYEVPPDLVEMGFAEPYGYAMVHAWHAWETLAEEHPLEAQYAVPLGYRIRVLWTLNLRELFHVVELRSGKQGHESYRRIAQALYWEACGAHPWLHKLIRVDLNDYPLARA